MPIDVFIEHERRRVTQVVRDPVSVDDVVAAITQQAHSDAWTHGTLVRCEHHAWVPLPTEIRHIAGHLEHLVRTHEARGPVAVVCQPGSALFGMFRMYGVLVEKWFPVAEFETEAAAETWLTGVAASKRGPS